MSANRSGSRGETATRSARNGGEKRDLLPDVVTSAGSVATVKAFLAEAFSRRYFRTREPRQMHSATPLDCLGHVHECHSLLEGVYVCQCV